MLLNLETRYDDYRKLFTTNVTATTFADPVDTADAPSGDGVVNWEELSRTLGIDITQRAYAASFQLFGVGANNTTGSVRVYGAAPMSGGKWHYSAFFAGDFTLSDKLTGVSGGLVGATELYADTIATSFGFEGISSAWSPGLDIGAASLMFVVPWWPRYVVKLIKGTATSVNAIVRTVY